MRRLLILALLLALSSASQAEARLFWQTYGSITAHPGGAGCAWNSNQDYFVPRQCHSGRYGLFSPCKQSCTDSPACKYQHPLYPGYCTTYGPFHYCRRNHVYHCYCGCCGLHPYKCNGVKAHWCCPLRYGCGAGCCCKRHRHYCGGGCGLAYCSGACLSSGPCQSMVQWPYSPMAPNVEPAGMQILGGLPIQGDELLASMGVNLEQSLQEIPDSPPAAETTLPLLGAPPAQQPLPNAKVDQQ